MKKYPVYASLLFLLLNGSCKKYIEQKQEDAVIQAMTTGQWMVTSFTQNGNNISNDFTNYRFKYYENKTVDAINNGTVQMTGTWDGNATTSTTSANFIGAVYPLQLINGSWHIDRNSWTYVEATQTNGSEVKTMRLDKQ
jgi:hypothetical protein